MAPFTLSLWLGGQFTKLAHPDRFKTDLTNKTVIVTGSNVGLGFEAAKHLARMSPGKLILACRSLGKADAAKAAIVKDTGCGTIECWELDQSSYASVTAFADRFEKEGGGRLDILIANAGLRNDDYTKTADGWETTIEVNHLATTLLALRLLPFLVKAPASPPTPRVVIVGSEVHYFLDRLTEPSTGTLLEKLGGTTEEFNSVVKPVSWYTINECRYPVSKLLNLFVTRTLASKLPSSSPLTINCVNPGGCKSELMRNVSPWHHVRTIMVPIYRSTEVGSRTLVHAAISPDLQGVSGEYLNAYKAVEPSNYAMSDKGKAVQQRIWDETVDVLAKVDPKVSDIIKEYLS